MLHITALLLVDPESQIRFARNQRDRIDNPELPPIPVSTNRPIMNLIIAHARENSNELNLGLDIADLERDTACECSHLSFVGKLCHDAELFRGSKNVVPPPLEIDVFAGEWKPTSENGFLWQVCLGPIINGL